MAGQVQAEQVQAARGAANRAKAEQVQEAWGAANRAKAEPRAGSSALVQSDGGAPILLGLGKVVDGRAARPIASDRIRAGRANVRVGRSPYHHALDRQGVDGHGHRHATAQPSAAECPRERAKPPMHQR